MKDKELDAFMRDYFRNDEEIAVNCNWLQDQLRLLSELERTNHKLLDIIEIKNELLAIKEPKYRLNVRA